MRSWVRHNWVTEHKHRLNKQTNKQKKHVKSVQRHRRPQIANAILKEKNGGGGVPNRGCVFPREVIPQRRQRASWVHNRVGLEHRWTEDCRDRRQSHKACSHGLWSHTDRIQIPPPPWPSDALAQAYTFQYGYIHLFRLRVTRTTIPHAYRGLGIILSSSSKFNTWSRIFKMDNQQGPTV